VADNGRIDSEQLTQLLSKRSDPVALIAVGGPAPDGRSALWRAEIVVGAENLVVGQRVWAYESCTFASCHMSTRDLGAWLGADAPRHFKIGSTTFELSLHSQGNYQHVPRWTQHDNRPTGWPSVIYSFSLTADPSRPFQPPGEMLVGPDAPAFVNFGVAFNAFFYENYALTASTNPVLGNVEVRVVDGRGRIGAIAIKPTQLEVEVGGSDLSNTTLELMATSDRASIALNMPCQAVVPLPNGLPSDAWLWLRTPYEWLDYRSLGGWASYRSPDVQDDRPTEPEAGLESIIAQGEGQHVEFKRQLPDNARDSRRTVFKTITAFANGQGGSVLFGVTDNGEVVGIADHNADASDRFYNMLRSSASPTPPCHVHVQTLGDKRVLVVEVEANRGTIYCVTIEADRPEFYVRRGATTFYARGEELEKITGNADRQSSTPWSIS
jgi:hypothetical protein